jgi:hypothetical protein
MNTEINIENTQDHAAKCKFCHCDVTLKIHPDALDMFNMDVWVKLAACNRCADYHYKRIAITSAIQAAAFKILANPKSEQADAQRGKLEMLTRRLAQNSAFHYKTALAWDQDWVAQIIETPHKATSMCLFYERSMWKTWNQKRREQQAVNEVLL